uniref:Ig-like domain-containing protein n=1 Tax=Oreochromis aureus TaxID=47969 RepID=A0AAZ1WVC7_OREAU
YAVIIMYVISCVGLTVSDQETITAKSGQNVTLTCRAPNNNIGVIEWSRADLKEDEYVLLYRDGHLDQDHQHPSFKNRSDLDSSMTGGDASVNMKNVSVSDMGIYKCEITTSKMSSGKKVLNEFNLTVTDTGGFVKVEDSALTAQLFIRPRFTPQRYNVGLSLR